MRSAAASSSFNKSWMDEADNISCDYNYKDKSVTILSFVVKITTDKYPYIILYYHVW